MELKKFDYDLMYIINLEMVHGMYKNQSEDFYRKEALAMTKAAKSEYVKANMSKKLQECGLSQKEADKEAEYEINKIPEELYQNILEWIEDKPISDIDYHGMSINKIIKDSYRFVNNKKISFLTALTIMEIYIMSDCKDKSVCRHYFFWDGGC